MSEKISLTRRDLDRLQVVQERARGRLPERQAAEMLGISGRGLRKLMKRFREQGERERG